MPEPETPDVVVVGAGIVGTYVALFLAKSGFDGRIVMLDRDPFGYGGASCGNLGGFATSEVRPLASLYNIGRALRWLMTPTAPVAVRPSYLPDLWPWLRVFLKSAMSPRHQDHVVKSQQALMRRARAAHLEALAGTGLENLINTNGTLCLYRSERRLEKDWMSRWRLYRDEGHSCRRLSEEDLRQRLPDLDPDLRHAIHVPDIYFWEDPGALLRGLHERVRSLGVEIRQGDVVGIEQARDERVAVRLAGAERIGCGRLVIAAGAWSKPLCLAAGDDVPLDTERGYHAMLPDPSVQIDNLLLLVEDDFVATPMRGGLRLGGTVELAGLDAPPDFERTALLANQIRDYFPGINTEGRTDWLGFRPSMPDGLPVMSRATTRNNVYYAFGHGHVGMTQSAIAGKLMAQIIRAERPELDMRPFSASRFKR